MHEMEEIGCSCVDVCLCMHTCVHYNCVCVFPVPMYTWMFVSVSMCDMCKCVFVYIDTYLH